MRNAPNPFAQPGRWWKGNLHMHTTRSDGRREPADAVAWYAEHGYDFVTMTDHRIAPEPENLISPRDGFLIIPGTELDFRDRETKVGYHLLCAGVDRTITLPESVTVQEALDIATESADLVYIAHPYWHGHDFDALRNLEGHCGVEIYNATCEMLCGKGLAVAYWDAALRESLVWGFAADDTHWNRPDAGKAWVAVRAEELTRSSLLEALRSGNFYSSTGPEIEHVEVDSDRICVRTSPVQRIIVAGPGPRGDVFYAEEGETICEAELRLGKRIKGSERYLRIHAVDAAGRVAWTNPVIYNP